jgi:hypothetical protein
LAQPQPHNVDAYIADPIAGIRLPSAILNTWQSDAHGICATRIKQNQAQICPFCCCGVNKTHAPHLAKAVPMNQLRQQGHTQLTAYHYPQLRMKFCKKTPPKKFDRHFAQHTTHLIRFNLLKNAKAACKPHAY